MAKRFTDTDKYKKHFIRGLPGAYKLLWDYLYLDCNHAGIWIVDFDIAQIYLGSDMPVDRDTALRLFNADKLRVIDFDDGKKWFIKPFIDFQYGTLNPNNRAHNSVISILEKENLYDGVKGLVSPLQGCKDKDKDMDMDMDKDKKCQISKILKGITLPPKLQYLEQIEGFTENWLGYWKSRKENFNQWPTMQTVHALAKHLHDLSEQDQDTIAVLQQSIRAGNKEIYPVRDFKQTNKTHKNGHHSHKTKGDRAVEFLQHLHGN